MKVGVYTTDYRFLSDKDLLHKSTLMNNLFEENLNLHMQLNDSINSELKASEGMLIDEILKKLQEKTKRHNSLITDAKTKGYFQTIVFEYCINEMNKQNIHIYYEVIEKMKNS